MNCPYCQGYMRTTYSCPCTPDFLLCVTCSDFQCHKCKKTLKLTPSPERCEACSVIVPAHRSFMAQKYYAFCVQCCFKCYTTALSQKRNVVSFEKRNHCRKQVPLSQIKIFLQKFCVKCHKAIQNSGKNSNRQEQEQDKKYYCETCYKQQTTQQNTLKPKDVVVSQSQIQRAHTKNDDKNNNEFIHERKQKHFQQKSMMNKQEQQRKCVLCNKVLPKNNKQFLASTNSDLSLCNICLRTSRLSQQIHEKYYKKQEIYSKHKGQEIKVKNDRHKTSSLANNQKQEDERQKKENGRQNISESVVMQKEVLHKPDLQKISIYEMNIKWVNDSQFVTCQICSIEVERDCSAIMPQEKKPICRSCFSDLIQKLNKQMAQTNSPKKINNYLGQTNIRKDETMQKYNYLDETQTKRTRQAVSPLPTNNMDLKSHASQNRRGITPSQKYSKQLPTSQPTTVQKRKQFDPKPLTQNYPLSVYSERVRQCPKCRNVKKMSDKYQSEGMVICLECKQKQTRQIQQRQRRLFYQLGYS